METFKAPEMEIINPNISPEIEGDNSVAYENWKAYEKAVEEGREEAPKEIIPKKHERYEFNVDKALDCIDLTFNGYTPSRDAIEFFNIMRLVYGEDFETDNALMHYFLVDLVYGNIKRENFPYSQEINEKIRLNSKKIAIIASRFSAKALTLDSKVITPTGYTTIKDVKIGDVVLDRDGKKCNVIAKSPIFNKPVYKMTLSDGRVIKMSDDHKCIVWKRKREMVAGKNRCKNNCPSGYTEVVMTAKELYESGVKTNRTPKKDGYSENDYKYWVPMMGLSESTIEYDSNDYGFDAYTTGVILGDGSTCKDTGYTRITAHKDDMFEYEKYIPYNFGKTTKKYVNGIEQNAVMFGLVGMGKSIKKWIGDERSYTKRVPEKLMNGSMFQRLEVLKGLMDTDGTVYKNGYCSFTSTSKGLAEDVQYLVQSLGGSAFVTESDTESEFGKAWSARIKINRIIFKLKRKVNRQVFRESYMRNPIESIEIIDNEPTQCISVSSPTHSFLTDGHTVTHNSTIITAFMPIVTAITGKMPNFGDVMFWVSFGDSQQAGAKVQANTIRDICEDSLFCKDYFEKMRFTDEECEFIRKDDPKNPLPIKKRCFMFKVKGAAGGSVRGIRYKTERPQCHEVGTIVETDLGIMRVEEYPFNHGVHIEDGLEIKLFGLTESERVTKDHKYWAKKCTNDQIYSKSEKRLVKKYIEEAPDWCEAKDLTRRHWLGSPIDYRVEDVQAIEHKTYKITKRNSKGQREESTYVDENKVPEYFNDNEWWWLYGLWLGDGQLYGTKKGKVGNNRYRSFAWSVAHTQSYIADKINLFFSKYNKGVSIVKGAGCDLYIANHSAIARWLSSHKNGNSIKNMPDWISKLDFEKQKQILLGYIAADGYIDNKKVSQQVRINSVNLNVLKQLQVICSRLGLPTYIRNTKKAGKQVFTSTGRKHDINHQWELRLVENVKEVLGIDVSASTKVHSKQVHIKDGILWRQFKESNEVKDLKVVPITCLNGVDNDDAHTYRTTFGLSHNCFTFDDIIKNEADAGSAIIMAKLKSMIYSDAENALGKKGKIIIVNTPFNKKDPVYQALEGGVWTPVCLPVCEKIYLDMPKSEYRGSWEAMKPFEAIMEKYEDAYYGDTLREFNQELMLRISSEEDKLIPDKLLEGQWYKRTDILKNLYAYNLYMTTDFTTTGNKGSDLSGIAVWAVNHNQDWFMLDLCLRKQEVEQQYNEVFRFIDTYTPENKTFEVGVEVDGNQRSHIHALKDRMRQRMNYFTIARQRGSQPGAEGILSRLEGGNKHWRMRMMLPMFQNRKIFFPEELRHSPDMVELMDEIRYTSYTKFNCVSGDTLVDTPNGKIMMSDIRHNDSVLTQNGYTSVNSNASNPIITGVEQTYTITTIDGEMHLTAEHKVLTMRGYVMVKDLTSTDLIIRNIECKLSNMDTNGQDKKVDIINQQHQLMEKENGFIVKYMKEKMEKLKKDMKFIIKMKIKTITNLLILKYYRLKIISLGILEEKNTGTIENKEEIMKVQKEKKKEKTETKIGFVRTVIVSLKSMIKLKMKQNSVANHAEENTVNFKKMRTILNLLQSNVLYAILNLNKNQQIKYAVQKSAEKYILKKTEEVKLSFDCACRATMNSKQLEALHESFAQKNVEILIETSSLQDAHAENVEKNLLKRLQNSSIAQIVASTSLIIKIEKRKIEPVYDFEVKGTNNFSSNNMVIHNCKHDDGMDLLSMINALEVIYPAKNMSYIPTKIKDGKVAADDIYGMINRHSDEEYSAYDSY